MRAQPSHTFTGAYALQLIQVLERWNVSAEQLLAGMALTESQLEDPSFRLSSEQLAVLSERARALSGEPGLGFYLGLQKRLSMYGHLGFASMNAGTVRELTSLAMRYLPTVSNALSFELEERDGMATFTIHEHVDLGSARDIGALSLVVGMRRMLATMTGRDPGALEVDLPFARPAYFDRFEHLLPNARFDQEKMRLRFDARALDLPLVTPDRAALRLAQEACERQLADLGVHGESVADRARALVLSEQRARSISEVARVLHVSTRTLKRKLALEGTSFSELLEHERRTRAVALLGSADLSLEAIASRLGYSNAASFSRAFRRWTGHAPTQHRAHQRKDS
jgi:AraC-like DNA-binding protein